MEFSEHGGNEAALALAADAAAMEVVPALSRAGAPPILLKGPAVASWLYGEEGGPRVYGDVDLLVAPQNWRLAERTLQSLGFERGQPGWQEVSCSWKRDADGAVVDVHRSLFGIGVENETAWRVLSRDAEALRLHGVAITVLGQAARAFHIATHSAQHGGEDVIRPREDLRRAVAHLDRDIWGRAGLVAIELDAVAAFAKGLSLDDGGREILAALDLPPARSIAVDLHADGAPPLVLGFEHLAAQRDWSARVRFVARKLFPPPRLLKRQSRIASHTAFGLVAAYPLHVLGIVARAPAGLLSWRRSRRLQSGSGENPLGEEAPSHKRKQA